MDEAIDMSAYWSDSGALVRFEKDKQRDRKSRDRDPRKAVLQHLSTILTDIARTGYAFGLMQSP